MHCCNALYVVYVNTVDTGIKAHNALNAMYVDTVNTGVCDFYTTLYTVYSVLCIQGLLPFQEGRLIVAISPVGLVVHQSEGAALLTFLDLSTTRMIAG